MKKKFKESLARELAKFTKLSEDTTLLTIDQPKNHDFGDFSFPCFNLAKLLKQSPATLAQELASKVVLPEGFLKVEVAGPYVNFYLDKNNYIKSFLRSVYEQPLRPEIFSVSTPLRDKNVVIDYSSPNIAKPFHVGHLRATLIGNCLVRLYKFLGSNVISVNHLGDWGTQFGYVWAGCKIWGKPAEPNVIKLLELYRKANGLKIAQENNKLTEDEKKLDNVEKIAKGFFIDLESNQNYAVEFWQWCREISLNYFLETYSRLDISFDHYTGESFYSQFIPELKERLYAQGLLLSSQEALGIDLGEELGFARIFTPDGRSLYLTRDIAAAEYRLREFDFHKVLYVVGIPQTLHYEQLKAILQKTNFPRVEGIEHIGFGHVSGMSSRGAGEFIEINSLMDEAQRQALELVRVNKSSPSEASEISTQEFIQSQQTISEGVAQAAIIFGTLSKNRLKDVSFSWEQALSFQGDTGPYVLYALARINSLIQKTPPKLQEVLNPNHQITEEQYQLFASLLSEDVAFSIAKLLMSFEETILKAVESNEPSILTSYALEIAKLFSQAYLELRITDYEDKVNLNDLPPENTSTQIQQTANQTLAKDKKIDTNLAQARLLLFVAIQKCLTHVVDILGMKILNKM